ncbi:MAG: DUF3298 domain-containing protein [Desulfovibrionaceae bacterium]
MRIYFYAMLYCVWVLVAGPTAAHSAAGHNPQIAEDALASTVPSPPLSAPAVQPTYAPLVDKQIRLEGTAPVSLSIVVNYPELGLPTIDKHIALWATNMANNFQENVTKEATTDDKTAYELQGKYTVSRPSAAAVSITYEVWTYTGGAHGNLDIITLNFDVEGGVQLSLEDLFKDVEQALELMSTYCYSVLNAELSEESTVNILKSGTSPDTENFSAITLLPNAILIHFQPYQVAPWSVGPQQVRMSLDDLASARPQLEIWGRKGT